LVSFVRDPHFLIFRCFRCYKCKVELLKRSINSLPWIKSGKISLQISTVDGFQGSEKDIIILSCVRSSSSNKPFNRDRASSNNFIGFLQDRCRVNVALTRARESLWIVGNCDVLYTNVLWAEIINDADRRQVIASPEEFHHLLKPRRKESHPTHNMQRQQRHCHGNNKRKKFSQSHPQHDESFKKQRKQRDNDPRMHPNNPRQGQQLLITPSKTDNHQHLI